MAVIPTGSASLRGVRPRAPRVTPGAFDIDIQELSRAAVAPARVKGVIEREQEASRERGIARETFEDRLATARVESAGGLAVAQPIQERRALEAGAAVETFGAEEELAAQNRMNELESGKQEALGIANEIENLQRNEEAIREANRNRRETELGVTRREAVEERTALTVAEGTPITRFEDRPGEGRVKISESRTPTGEFITLGEEQVATQAELDIEAAQLQAAMQRAEAFMLQQKRLNRGKTQPFVNKTDFGNPLSVTVVTTSPEGEISVETFPLNPKGALPDDEGKIEFNIPGDEEGVESFGELEAPIAPIAPIAPAAPVAPAAPAAPKAAPVVERGMTFVPTGEAEPGFERGGIYTNANGERVIYTGGNPNDPSNQLPAPQ